MRTVADWRRRNRSPMRNIIASFLIVLIVPWPARAADGNGGCRLGGDELVTVTGTIRFLFTRVVPIMNEQGHPDYSIVDYYELSSVEGVCGPGPLRVRIEFGDVKTVSCADGVAVASQLKCESRASP
jgi:hypothetical protein